MRIIPFLLFGLLTIILIILFNTTLVLPAPLGKLLSPQQGIWQNAEAVDHNYSKDLEFADLQGNATVYFDERLVPHVFTENDHDAYFIQGYLHARFRLWQMELQAFAAAGRVSEVIGDKGLDHDREFRRLGMVFAAENSLVEMEKDPATKASLDAYSAGVNSYIRSLSASSLPLEYKLIGYEPELWNNFKIALFLKYMSYDLAGHDIDFEMTNARAYFNPTDFSLLFPDIQDSLDPIIPGGTIFPSPTVRPIAPNDSLVVNGPVHVQEAFKPDRDNGSNNWAVSGSKTASGSPILCNDPHLGLNLPSLWYEIQLSTPSFNAYGASFPGAPSVIIGFNDSCAFGFTNGGRDVRDYYEIKFKDGSRKEYWFDSSWRQSSSRIEQIKVAGKPVFQDTVIYTLFGPVMYDEHFSGKRGQTKRSYAVRWKAHDPSNELQIFQLLNRAKNYSDYNSAVTHLHTPGQNCVFASKGGDIAIRTQGEFPAKWKGQGDYIMSGTDSAFLWQGMIPQEETPFQYNPERGFVSSANQRPADSSYPYYLGREYPSPRGRIINRLLAGMQQISVKDMMTLQTNNYNIFAEMARPIFLKNINSSALDATAGKYFRMMQDWDLRNDPNSVGATVFEVSWKQFKAEVYSDEYVKAPQPIQQPFESTLLEALLRDSAYKFIDNVQTPVLETLADIAKRAFVKATADLRKAEAEGRLEWAKYKDTRINHLSRLPALGRFHLPIGGGTNIINATKQDHGPSWRMIVHLAPVTEAYGVYPGGQSGNPGSRFYDNFVDHWVAGNYYTLWMMTKQEAGDKRVKWTMNFKKAS